MKSDAGRRSSAGIRIAVVLGLLTIMSSVAPAQAPYRQPAAPDYIKLLEDPHRIDRLKPVEIIEKIGLAPGNIVADIGSGSGLFTRPMARAVAPGGRVFAVDKDLLRHVAETAAQEHISSLSAANSHSSAFSTSRGPGFGEP